MLKISKQDTTAIFLSALLYLSLVIGGVLPVSQDSELHNWVRLVLLITILVVLPVMSVTKKALTISFLYVCIVCAICTPSIVESENINYALYKIESLTLGTVVSFLIGSVVVRRYGWIVLYKSLLVVGVLVLSMTVLYKMKFGMFDREVRFLLNGPIVFGWIMGMMSLLSLVMYTKGNNYRYIFSFGVFLVAVIWTQSKGPLISLLLFSLMFMIDYLIKVDGFKFSIKKSLFFILLTFFSLVVFTGVFDTLENNRLESVVRLVEGDLEEVDEGSVAVRMDMLRTAIDLFKEATFTGIGMGNWKTVTGSYFMYPHNQHIEVLVEMGIVIFLMYLLFVTYCLMMSSNEIKVMILFFMLCASFSGDLPYLRFPFVFMLLSLFNRVNTHAINSSFTRNIPKNNWIVE